MLVDLAHKPSVSQPDPSKSALTSSSPSSSTASQSQSISTSKQPVNGVTKSPFFPTIDPSTAWPSGGFKIGKGLRNAGNTCFLNSSLQVLLHTPPLVRYLKDGDHPFESCKKPSFCMACSLQKCVMASFQRPGGAYVPIFLPKLKLIAKHFRLGRQEDSHEFLRFCIDGLQESALFGKSPKLEQRLKESTFVHQIFGGRLRSRVKCTECGHPSDTFDSVLDLSLDVNGCDSIKQALNRFVRVDTLKGSNKYKCEKCKKLVVAEKNFTICDAPMILTIHLKRFTPTGRKYTDLVKYPELLDLAPYMSDGHGPKYSLYGVVNHMGGGPNSGHYTAFVKSSEGRWHEMDDDYVTASRAPGENRSAYILFYVRQRGSALDAAINGGIRASNGASHKFSNSSGNSVSPSVNGKRPRESDANEQAGPSKKKGAFIGPTLPPSNATPNGSPSSHSPTSSNATSFYSKPNNKSLLPNPFALADHKFATPGKKGGNFNGKPPKKISIIGGMKRRTVTA
ncbi:cysteine proteinase [Meredithblackwellia eburnea MCA 4105]